ncbi:hypothetical protein HanXRQr2_Chr08g0356051 [Helianthus annuus]|uniref:Uncharacterized protein n=1 Tax=Helianthus annuus TaxID=4232 RepID=A0A9K3IGV3_HELAN|nr:hypothetical protein HanXRQr2_Chr08g0356051 [Helianthus annuus]KAJ0842236.1 hypothetical protein HanPSC8_Chr14g0639351 [Helianthus annuus]
MREFISSPSKSSELNTCFTYKCIFCLRIYYILIVLWYHSRDVDYTSKSHFTLHKL